jgi:transposase
VSDMAEGNRKKRRPRRSFTDEYKSEAVRLVLDEGKTVVQVAQELDLTASALRTWVMRAQADRGRGKRGVLTSAEREELAKLRKDVRELRMERDILKNDPAPSVASVARETPAYTRPQGHRDARTVA